jgi:hypothetical protein
MAFHHRWIHSIYAKQPFSPSSLIGYLAVPSIYCILKSDKFFEYRVS